ncbi:hypothetical protein Tco_1217256 [Tanacetum coccineum]
MSTLAEYMIVAGAENYPLMLDKTMYNSWQSRMFLYLKGNKNDRMMLKAIENGPLVYPTIEENGAIRTKKYAELSEQEQLQDECDVQATNIVLQVLPPDVYSLINHCQVDKEIWDRVKLLMQGTELSYQEHECCAVLVFLPGDDLIACLNKAMAFMSTIVASSFPPTNNQLRTYSNPRNQATIHDGRVTIQQVQGRHGQSFAGTRTKGNATSSGETMQLVRQGLLSVITARADDLDAYDSDCDDISLKKVVLMANLSSDPYILSEMSEQMANQVTHLEKVNKETITVNESLTVELKRYKERVKTFKQRLNVDLNSHEKMIDSQMEDMILNRNVLKQEINSLKQTLSKQVKENESLLQTFNIFKKESKEKEREKIDKEIELEKKIKN